MASSFPASSTSNGMLSVGIVFFTWPSWFYVLQHDLFSVKWMLCCNCKELQFLRQHFPDSVELFSLHSLPASIPSVDVLAFNGPLRGFSCPPSCGAVCLFDWKFRTRGSWPGWRLKTNVLCHAAVGGCSSHQGWFTVAVRSSTEFSLPVTLINEAPLTNLSSILRCTGSGFTVKGPPPALVLQTEVGAPSQLGKNIFHYKGFYPFDAVSPRFVVPSVFAASKWVKRVLSLAELLDVYDIPHIYKAITRSLLRLFSAPLKSLYSVVFCTFFRCATGGGYCFSFSSLQ